MKIYNIYVVLAAMALTFAACTQEADFTPQIDSDTVKINATIGKLQTRVAYEDDGATDFINGDEICVVNTMRTSKNIATYRYTNYGTYNEPNMAWTTTDALVWNGGTAESQFQAWYPASASFDKFTLPTLQNDNERLATADWMTASTSAMVKPDDKTINLAFEHKLAKITVQITEFTSQFSEDAHLAPTTTIYSLMDDNVTVNGGIKPIVRSNSATAIVCPGKYAPGSNLMEITISEPTGETYLDVPVNDFLTNIGLEAGKHYSFSLKVGKDAISIDKVYVEPWTEYTIDGGIAEEVVPVATPYLTFTAEKENALTIKTSSTYTLDESIEYSINDGEWVQVIANTPMEFGGAKGTLRLRGKSATGLADGADIYAKMVFDNNNPVACSGDIRTLVDYENFATADTKDARFFGMFEYCSNLTEAPELPNTTLADYCYTRMFFGCSALTEAPELPATTLAYHCYRQMFYDCSALTEAPELPATTLEGHCYRQMFFGCSALTEAPELPATTLAEYCYVHMFNGCTNLTKAPSIIPAASMPNYCCQRMFENCINLKTAPELPATTVAYNCYHEMFNGCTSLTTAPSILPATTLADSCYHGMFENCINLKTAPELPATTLADNCYFNMFTGSGLEKAPKLPAMVMTYSCYWSMFKGCTSLTEAPELPATTLAQYCYYSMFEGSGIVKAMSKLPATTLAPACYCNMFYECSSLSNAPELPATTLTDNCYNYMFYGCSSLTKAPKLPATTLATNCYAFMFYKCSSLTEAPVLPATTLALQSYWSMFGYCKNLSSVTMLATDVSAKNCLYNWLIGVSATGTFTKAAEMTSLPVGTSGIPQDWSVVDYQ